MSDQPTPADAEVTILVGAVSREEFLGEGDEADFVQPSIPGRYTLAASSKPVEQGEGE